MFLPHSWLELDIEREHSAVFKVGELELCALCLKQLLQKIRLLEDFELLPEIVLGHLVGVLDLFFCIDDQRPIRAPVDDVAEVVLTDTQLLHHLFEVFFEGSFVMWRWMVLRT